MTRSNRSSLTIGVLIGFAGRGTPSQSIRARFLDVSSAVPTFWVWIVIGVGAALFLIGALTGSPDMAIPGCIVGGIGCILFYQNLSSDWASWAYMWALIPGFAGIGVLLARALGDSKQSIRSGVSTIISSLIMFIIFGTLLGGMFSGRVFWAITGRSY